MLGDFNVELGGTQPNFVCALSSETRIVKDLENIDILSAWFDTFYKMHQSGVSFGLLADLKLFGRPIYSSFKVYPSILNSIFSVGTSLIKKDDKTAIFHDGVSYDQFYNVVDFNTQVIRNLDRLGLPY